MTGTNSGKPNDSATTPTAETFWNRRRIVQVATAALGALALWGYGSVCIPLLDDGTAVCVSVSIRGPFVGAGDGGSP